MKFKNDFRMTADLGLFFTKLGKSLNLKEVTLFEKITLKA
jgi:hypothetical protein